MQTVVTRQQYADDPTAYGKAIDRLVLSTGADRVSNSWLQQDNLFDMDAVRLTVGFDPKGWTGC